MSMPVKPNQHVSNFENDITNKYKSIHDKKYPEVEINGYRGVWINKGPNESPSDLKKYSFYEDPEPTVVKKTPTEPVKYKREVSVRFLKPIVKPPGNIIIRQEPDIQLPAPPPIIIRQHVPSQASTPKPMIIREEPPQLPSPLPEKIITIPGRVLPPPPRQVIYERVPCSPTKPQDVIIEKWLPPEQPQRQVIYDQPQQQAVHHPGPFHYPKIKNVIIEFEEPTIQHTIQQTYPTESIQQQTFSGYSVNSNQEYYKRSQQSYLQPPTRLANNSVQTTKPCKSPIINQDLKKQRLYPEDYLTKNEECGHKEFYHEIKQSSAPKGAVRKMSKRLRSLLDEMEKEEEELFDLATDVEESELMELDKGVSEYNNMVFEQPVFNNPSPIPTFTPNTADDFITIKQSNHHKDQSNPNRTFFLNINLRKCLNFYSNLF